MGLLRSVVVGEERVRIQTEEEEKFGTTKKRIRAKPIFTPGEKKSGAEN